MGGKLMNIERMNLKYLIVLLALIGFLQSSKSQESKIIENNYFHEQRLRSFNEIRMLTQHDESSTPAYIEEFKKPTLLMEKGDSLYRKLIDFCAKYKGVKNAPTIKELLDIFKIPLEEIVPKGQIPYSEQVDVSNIIIHRGPVCYSLNRKKCGMN